MDVLNFTIASNDFIDTLRLLAVFLGGILGSFALVRFLMHERFWSAIGFGGLGIITSMQQADYLHDPLNPIRLFVQMASTTAGIIFMYKRYPDDLGRAARACGKSEEL